MFHNFCAKTRIGKGLLIYGSAARSTLSKIENARENNTSNVSQENI